MLRSPMTIPAVIRSGKKHPRFRFAAFWAASVFTITLGLGTPLAKAEPTAKADNRPEASGSSESVWIISTRGAPLCGRRYVMDASLDYWRLCMDENGNDQWRESDKDAFHAADISEGPTCFHIHGNRTSHYHAINEGQHILKALRRQADGRKFRLVIWSWPTMRIKGGNRKDIRVKAARSDVQAYYLARCLRRMNPDAQVGMIGYSFGARVIAGALEILAGGQIAGYRLDMVDESTSGSEAAEATATRGELPRLRVALIASATDRCWFLPGRRNGSALDVVDWAIITSNPCDPVLKHYPKMYGRRGPQAAGYTGPALTLDQRLKTEVLNMSCSVGKSHSWCSYLSSSCLYWRLGECVFDD